jgi:hypothetical protein
MSLIENRSVGQQFLADPIPGTDRVQCKCGWQGTTEDLADKTCPICGEAFKAENSQIEDNHHA